VDPELSRTLATGTDKSTTERSAPGRRGRGRTRTGADTVDTADVDRFEKDDDTDTSFTSLENHLFGARYLEDYGVVVDEAGNEQTTMLNKSASAADTVVQRSLNLPPPTQVVTVLPPGSRPTDRSIGHSASSATPAPAKTSSGAGNLAAAGGVFAGVSMVAAGSLVALGLVCAVAIYLLMTGDPVPVSPGTVPAPVVVAAPAPAPETPSAPAPVAAAAPVPPSDDPVVAELQQGVKFPATFRFNDWRPMDVDQAAFAALVEKLGRCPGHIRVTGHADYRGTDLTNDTFALARAGEVRKMLGNEGLDRKKIEVASVGADEPTVQDDSPESRAENRRVVVTCVP
jgi:outer membrane protein OmpA-like peptidoglycan-associated protein